MYRRKHKKGQEEESTKRRTKRTHKFQRAVVGATLQDIIANRNQKPEVRKAQPDQAIRAAKEVKRTQKVTTSKKAAPAAKPAAKAPKAPKAAKTATKAAPRVGGKR